MSDQPFNGADPAAFDHDGDGKPGGGKARMLAVVDLAAGVVAGLPSAEARAAVKAGTHRLATTRDVRLHGRDDLLTLIKEA